MVNVNGIEYSITEDLVMMMADDMAASATTFNSQGYKTFIDSRDTLKLIIHEIFDVVKDKLI